LTSYKAERDSQNKSRATVVLNFNFKVLNLIVDVFMGAVARQPCTAKKGKNEKIYNRRCKKF
jgi:hypothetical protein